MANEEKNVANQHVPAENPDTPVGDVKPEVKAKKAKPPKEKKEPKAAVKREAEVVYIDPKNYDRVVIAADENDPHWDAKLKIPVPEGLINNLVDLGWDPSSMIAAVRAPGGKLKIIHGRTRWRALEKANKLRAKEGKEPLTVPFSVSDEDPADDTTIVRNMERNIAMNYGVQEIDPMTTAEDITRLLSAGVDEQTVAKRFSKTVNEIHGYLLLTDEDKCPPKMQELIREGKMPFTAAVELARKAESMTKAEVTQMAEQIAKVAAGGLKVTTSTVKKAAGKEDEKVATKKEIKQFLLDLQSDMPDGKLGHASGWGAIIGIEVALGTRSITSAKNALDKLAKGHAIKVDFKQYQDGNKKE